MAQKGLDEIAESQEKEEISDIIGEEEEGIPQDIVERLQDQDFEEKEEKPGLWYKSLGSDKACFWDFRKEKKGSFYVRIPGGYLPKDEAKEMEEYTYVRGEEEPGETEETKETEHEEKKGEEPEETGKKETGAEEPKGKRVESNLEKIRSIVGNDLLEIFGPTGTGKSKIVYQLAMEALKNGKKVFYYDSERNLNENNVKKLGGSYHYSPMPDDLLKWSDNINRTGQKYDLIVVDSVAFPALVKFARMNLKQRGEALLGLIATLGSLKEYCYKNKSIVIATSQPISELSGKTEEERYPFGEKSCFAVKEIWLSSVRKGRERSVITVSSWRSRDMGYGTVIVEVEISGKGVVFNWKI